MQSKQILMSVVLTVLITGTGWGQWADKEVENEISGMTIPDQIEQYHPVFHFPPVNQDTTQICWSFSTLSFIETEMQRIGLEPVKLSVVYPVYYTFVEKARYFIHERGQSRFEPGDLFSTVFEIIQKYGIVPQSVYRGQVGTNKTYNQDALYDELKAYMQDVKSEGRWDEEPVVARVKEILNRHVGLPPDSFEYEGKAYTPLSFLHEQVRLPWDDYILVTSFMYAPFDTYCTLEVPDNWRLNDRYFNVQLPLFYQSLKSALQRGYSAAIDGDISETGRCGEHDIAFVPHYDIPSDAIDQEVREYRFEKGLTQDDHLMHVIGFTTSDNADWFLIKDSWRDAWEGDQKGYFFYRGDFVKLKVLAYLVHRNAVPEIIARIPKNNPVNFQMPFENGN
jgi:bleomycin hydrolase